ncbi:unconventional myosin-If [Platysternon megacephalum]|uniref:Unconventional myosin-If n=1 Tax=Platysternon megacephalum TaxID=55544 RepID=A0A4D9E5J2_9SAUR|nr:unconventional myosin-If [Platysternon megacephalum]
MSLFSRTNDDSYRAQRPRLALRSQSQTPGASAIRWVQKDFTELSCQPLTRTAPGTGCSCQRRLVQPPHPARQTRHRSDSEEKISPS